MPATRGDDLLTLMLGRLGVGVIVCDAAGRVEALSPLASRLTEWAEEEARGQPLESVFPLLGESAVLPGDPAVPPLARPLPDTEVDQAILVSRTGRRFAVEHTMAPLRGDDGSIRRILVAFRDVSRQNFALLQLARQTTHEPVTGLLNRQAFASRLERELQSGARPFALLHVDLDRFNLVNTACGHVAGDELLQWVAALLREECRETDVLARLGGDVFAILLGGTGANEAQSLAESLLVRLACFQFTWGDRSFPVGACIGLVSVDSEGGSAEELLSLADYACALAKRRGRNQIHICSTEGEENTRRQQELEWVTRIRANLRDGNAVLYAQPIRPLTEKPLPGTYFEVLLRVAGGSGELVSAERVIRAAERYGLMGTVDRWVIRSTFETLAAQSSQVLGRLRLCSLNLSAVSLHDRSILDYIHQQLARSRIPPRTVCFELTETAAVESISQARWLIQELLAIGCRFALDDFGSGIASYGYLNDLPVNYVKIAGAFVENIVGSPVNAAMVSSIQQLARVLGVETIAESVSTASALRTVTELGVDYAQGRWIAEPQPLPDVCSAA